MDKPIQQSTMMINDLDALKVFAHSLRYQILEKLSAGPATVNQIAGELGLTSSKLYYHMNQLEKHGFIKVVSTHMVGNIIEKEYGNSADDFEIAPEVCQFGTDSGNEGLVALTAATIETTRDDFIRSIEARIYELEHGGTKNPRMVTLNRGINKISAKHADKFHERLQALMREFDEANVEDLSEEDDPHAYSMMLAFYPTFYYPTEETQ